MRRLILGLVVPLFALCVYAQTVTQTSDAQAVSLAQQSIISIGKGVAISDVTLNANIIWLWGTDDETGTATFKAKGSSESRVDLNLGSNTRSDVRSASGGAWQLNGAAATPYAFHNCQTDAAWFFPAMSSLAQTANPSSIFKYVGQEQRGGVSTQHIRVFQVRTQDPAGVLQQLSTIDFYLDPTSGLPIAIAFNSHPDNDLNTNIPNEVRFTNYQSVSGILIPFHFQHMVNGSVVLDATVTSATVNSGLPDSLFTLQ